jgi:2-polyprenyl-3-methyl-5-hydroxy-6-metoxy-1,4-benzoquinol methylase
MREKRTRPLVADADLNTTEHAWWERNAALVARFWEMDPSFSGVLRRGYLSKIRSFFMEGRKDVTVLELGCGSGWVGQSIAGAGLRILGTDFSEAQLGLARRNAEARGLGEAATYRLSTSAEWPEETPACNAVLIHSFLHHLDDPELDDFLDNLKARTSPGTRIVLFEPAFYEDEPSGSPRPWTAGANRLAARLVARIDRDQKAQSPSDEQARAAFVQLFTDANERGWYLSPKEIPFGLEDFTRRLSDRFEVRQHGWAVIDLIGWAFERNLMSTPPPREHWLWPFVVRLDALVASDAAYLGRRLRRPAHAFHLWYAVRR